MDKQLNNCCKCKHFYKFFNQNVKYLSFLILTNYVIRTMVNYLVIIIKLEAKWFNLK